jgi:acyl carrier protein
MTKRIEIFKKIQPIFREILKDKNLILKEETSPSEIKNWDSLNHLTIIVEIEKQLNCNFTTKEIAKLNCVGDFVYLILKKS